MTLCWKTVSATQFTLYMALSNMGRAFGSGLVGTLKEQMDWDYVFMITAISPLIAFIILRFLNFSKHLKTIKEFSNLIVLKLKAT